MAYYPVGVRVEQNLINETVIPIEAELATCIVGPLYEVFVEEASGIAPVLADFYAGTLDVAWPQKRVGTVVDLAGTRNGFIDTQRKSLADFVPSFKALTDGTIETVLPDNLFSGLDQDGFTVDIASLLETVKRVENDDSFLILNDQDTFVYSPFGGLSSVRVGDIVSVIEAPNDTKYGTVTQSGSTKAFYDTNVGGITTMTPDEFVSSPGFNDIIITPSSTPGRINIQNDGDDFLGVANLFTPNQTIVVQTGYPIQGLTGIQGQMPAIVVSANEFEATAVPTVTVSAGQYDGYMARVINYGADGTYTTPISIEYLKVESIISTSNSFVVEFEAGSVIGNVNDYVSLSILKSEVGYMESVNDNGDEMVVVFPTPFADTLCYVNIYDAETSASFAPVPDILTSYRALRKDISNQVFRAASSQELLSSIDQGSVTPFDNLGFFVNTALQEQDNSAYVYFIPADNEPESATGLPENTDLTLGIQEALEIAESIEVHDIVLTDLTTGTRAALESHVLSMSTEAEGRHRRGYMYDKMPLGDVNSTTGAIEPGYLAAGSFASVNELNSGNKVIRDDSVEFVTEANVIAGTRVVVTFPEEFAGEYTALGTTTDSVLVLDGDDWPIVKEFTSDTATANTDGSGFHTISGVDTGLWAAVEPGDFVEINDGGTYYRFRISAVAVNGASLVAEPLVSGNPTFVADAVTDVKIIRSWSGSTAVQYYIRPLTNTQKVDKLIAAKTLANPRFTLSLDYTPVIEFGVNESGVPIEMDYKPELTLAAIAAKRSGRPANAEATNQVLRTIKGVNFGYSVFRNANLNDMAEAGYTILIQKDETARPYIRDMVTSAGLVAGLVNFEELVISGIDWITKVLQNSFATPIGAQVPNQSVQLRGLRFIQVNALIKSWVDNDRIVSGRIISLEQDSINKRQTNVNLEVVMIVAEKEIKVTINTTV